MFIYRLFYIAWKGIRSYPLRVFLAIAGVSFSSLLVIFSLTLIHNFEKSLLGQLEGIGAQQIVAMPGKLLNNQGTNVDAAGMLSFASIPSTLTEEDVIKVKKSVKGLSGAAAQMETISIMHTPEKGIEVLFTGVSPDLLDIFDLNLLEGRFLTDEDRESGAVVLGFSAKRTLFGDKPALGKKVTIEGLEWTVIGVLDQKNFIGLNFNERVYASIPKVKKATNLKYASLLFFKSDTISNVNQMEREIDQVIKDNHGRKDFNLVKPDETLHIISVIVNLVKALILGITCISFLVGGIGILNVMILTVQERTREIGIRKAVGATSINILTQFLLEAIMISLIGCIIGTIESYGLIQLFHLLFPVLSAEMPFEILGISLLYAIILGIVSGIFPAMRAVSIEPVDALRYE